MPEARTGKGLHVIPEADDVILRALEGKVREGIKDRDEEGNEDADRDEKRWCQGQIGTKGLSS
jgi:hypothetical protein